MQNLLRLEFVTRHYHDLQTIRVAPIPLLMLSAPALQSAPHPSLRAGVGLFLILFVATVSFFYWSTAAIQRRYGQVNPGFTQRHHTGARPFLPLFQFIFVAVLLGIRYFFPQTDVADYLIGGSSSLIFLTRILDTSNVTKRRVAWAIGLVILLAGTFPLSRVTNGAPVLALAGAVWLALSAFDFLLLRNALKQVRTG